MKSFLYVFVCMNFVCCCASSEAVYIAFLNKWCVRVPVCVSVHVRACVRARACPPVCGVWVVCVSQEELCICSHGGRQTVITWT